MTPAVPRTDADPWAEVTAARLPAAGLRLAGGFVVVPADRPSKPVARTVRLRRIAGDLYVPVDADPLPALHPDEAAGLTRDRGLVSLPSGAPLAFDPAAPHREADLLAFTDVRRSAWEPLPAAPTLADRLTVIRAETPPSVVVDVLTSGRPDDACLWTRGRGAGRTRRPRRTRGRLPGRSGSVSRGARSSPPGRR